MLVGLEGDSGCLVLLGGWWGSGHIGGLGLLWGSERLGCAEGSGAGGSCPSPGPRALALLGGAVASPSPLGLPLPPLLPPAPRFDENQRSAEMEEFLPHGAEKKQTHFTDVSGGTGPPPLHLPKSPPHFGSIPPV